MSSDSLVPADVPQDPSGEDDAPHADPSRARAKSGGKRRPQQGPILTADDCRRMLAQLLKLTAAKLISPGQANAMAKVLKELLADARESQAARPAAALNDNLKQILRASPDLLEFVAPLLTPEKLAEILGGDDGTHEA